MSPKARPFFGAEGEDSLSDDLFFSFVTLTTTGYGNLVPAGNPGQTLAVFEALVGQIFLVTAIGKVVSAWRPRRWRPSPEEAQGGVEGVCPGGEVSSVGGEAAGHER